VTIKNYAIIIALAFTGFIGTCLYLIDNSREASVIDKTVVIYDDDKSHFDTLHFKSNLLKLEKRPVAKLDTAKVKVAGSDVRFGELTFNQNPNYLIWIMLIGAATGVAFASWPIALFLFKDVKKGVDLEKNVQAFVIGAIILFSVFAMAQLSAGGRIFGIAKIIDYAGIMFENPGAVLGVVTVFIMSPNFIAVPANFLIAYKLEKEDDLHSQILLHKRFTQFLTISSVILVFGVITPTFLRLSVLGFFPSQYAYLFPSQFVFAYSLVFTFSLAAIFLPVEFAFRNRFIKKKKEATEGDKELIDKVLSQVSIFKIGLSTLAPVLVNILLDGVNSIL